MRGELFFQRHAKVNAIPGVKLLDPALDPSHDSLLEISSATGLLSAAQMNTIEFHTWNALAASINKPDRMTFDLDPGDKLPCGCKFVLERAFDPLLGQHLV